MRWKWNRQASCEKPPNLMVLCCTDDTHMHSRMHTSTLYPPQVHTHTHTHTSHASRAFVCDTHQNVDFIANCQRT